ncbi:hypothetical protein DVJ78_00420 [Humibacter sp. BT305]|nr:hypothetical protein DVJ78_00420 [Humibacter sp. BT305]
MNARERGRRTARALTGVLAVTTVVGSGVGAVVLWHGTEEAKASASESSPAETGATESGTTGSESSTSPTPTSTPQSTGTGSSTGGLVAPSQGGSGHATSKGS